MKQGSNITVVGWNGDKVTIEREMPNGQAFEHCKLPDCGDAPRAGFKKAFAALLPLALGLVEITDKRWKDTARVTILRVSKEPKGGRRNFGMTIVPALEFGGTSINTPLRRERLEEDEVGVGYAEPELIKAIEAVLNEAHKYVSGDRAQLVLPIGDGKEPEHEAEVEVAVAPVAPSKRKRSRKR